MKTTQQIKKSDIYKLNINLIINPSSGNERTHDSSWLKQSNITTSNFNYKKLSHWKALLWRLYYNLFTKQRYKFPYKTDYED